MKNVSTIVNLGSTFTEDVRVHREVLQLPKHTVHKNQKFASCRR